MSDKGYIEYLDKIITNLPRTEKEKQAQRIYDIFMAVLILVPIIIGPVLIALNKVFWGVSVLVLSYGLVVIIGVLKRRSIINRFYKIKNITNKVNLIDVDESTVLDELYTSSSLTFIGPKEPQLLSFIYNWLNNKNILKNEIINIYIVTGENEVMKENYDFLEPNISLLCILPSELNITEENIEEFSKERYLVGARYFDDIIDNIVLSKKKGEKNMNIEEINSRISDRSECFYWQTDRKISAEEAAMIWKDRHSAITNEELLEKINLELTEDKLAYIKPFDQNAQTSLGNVNSIRVGVLESGKEVIIRCHPKGIKNGYFYAESLASSIALENKIPAYKTLCIHELENENDISYQVIEKLSGDTVQFCLKENSDLEETLVYEMGKTMAKLHKIKVNGFGPFDNNEAKEGNLIGLHKTLHESINAGLDENLERLIKYDILSKETANKMKLLFENNELLDSDKSVLIHNDFADWNLLTDGKSITGVIDWDECVGGNPIQEIACWSTFFDPKRIEPFLKGYFSETKKYDNFDEMFQLMRLRYTISKMALRIKRYTYEQTPFLKSMIEKGEKHLDELSEIFNLK